MSKKLILLPNKIAIPWLKNEPIATPNNILIGVVLLAKDIINNCVLSPNSVTKTKANAIKTA
ncbi:MAG: hypothetical protein V8R30_06910 [Clostridia bacterium]